MRSFCKPTASPPNRSKRSIRPMEAGRSPAKRNSQNSSCPIRLIAGQGSCNFHAKGHIAHFLLSALSGSCPLRTWIVLREFRLIYLARIEERNRRRDQKIRKKHANRGGRPDKGGCNDRQEPCDHHGNATKAVAFPPGGIIIRGPACPNPGYQIGRAHV